MEENNNKNITNSNDNDEQNIDSLNENNYEDSKNDSGINNSITNNNENKLSHKKVDNYLNDINLKFKLDNDKKDKSSNKKNNSDTNKDNKNNRNNENMKKNKDKNTDYRRNNSNYNNNYNSDNNPIKSLKDNVGLNVFSAIFSNILAILLFITLTATIFLVVFENIVLKDSYVQDEIKKLQDEYQKPVEELNQVAEIANNNKDKIQNVANVTIPTTIDGNIDTTELMKKYGNMIDTNTINSKEIKDMIQKELKKNNINVSTNTVDKVTDAIANNDQTELRSMSKKAKILKECMDIISLSDKILYLLIILDIGLAAFILLFNILNLYKGIKYYGRVIFASGLISIFPKIALLMTKSYLIDDTVSAEELHIYDILQICANNLLYVGVGTIILGIGLLIVYAVIKSIKKSK